MNTKFRYTYFFLLNLVLCLITITSSAQFNVYIECGSNTADLSLISAANQPDGISLTWHSSSPATDANQILAINSVAAGFYYAAFYDGTNDCYSTVPNTVTVSPLICIENTCPDTFIDFTAEFSGTNLPEGAELTFHTNDPPTNANKIEDPSLITQIGIYYGAYYDDEFDCYSAAIPISFISNPGCAVPVELASFSGKMEDCAVLLNWHTENELQNDYFQVERSNNQKDFAPIGVITGAGNSLKATYYSLNDENPLPGESYYRLKQVDFDGTFTYSDIIVVQNNCINANQLLVFPNPLSGSNDLIVRTYVNQISIQLVLFDITGKPVWQIQQQTNPGWNDFKLDLKRNLVGGTYTLQMRSGNSIEQVKFVKL